MEPDLKRNLIRVTLGGLVLGALIPLLLQFLLTVAPAQTRAELWTMGYQCQGPLTQTDLKLEVWTQEPPDTAWLLDHVQPLEQSGQIAVWVTRLTKIKARSVRTLAAIPPSRSLPGVPEQRLYSTWSNELRFATPMPQPSRDPKREHVGATP